MGNILSGYNKSQNILIEVLQTARNKNATDSRDKVFGVLGLVNNWLTTSPILPDYTLTDIEVFAQVTVNWITNRRDLFILTGNMLRRPHIPSWIQDWAPAATFEGTEYHHETGWNALYWKYSASLTKGARSKLLSNSELQLEGIFVDKVSRVALQMVTNDWNDAKFFIDSWEEFVDISELLEISTNSSQESMKNLASFQSFVTICNATLDTLSTKIPSSCNSEFESSFDRAPFVRDALYFQYSAFQPVSWWYSVPSNVAAGAQS